MIPVPQSLLEFTRMFPDEEACVQYLALLRWPTGFVCEACASEAYWAPSKRAVKCPQCNTQTYLTAGTIMHRSHTPLQIWFYAAFLDTTLTPGISAVQLQQQLGLTRYETAFQMLHKIRSAMVNPA